MEFQRYTNTEQEGWQAIWQLYEHSFPTCETRMERDHIDAMRDPQFYAMGIWEAHTLIGLLFYWYNGEFCYVEHFATLPCVRGKGYGAQCLKELCARYPMVLLEIEVPVDEMTRRRQGFYERSGFQVSGYQHSHPPYRSGDDPHELIALSHPGPLTPELDETFLAYRKTYVMRYSEAGRASRA